MNSHYIYIYSHNNQQHLYPLFHDHWITTSTRGYNWVWTRDRCRAVHVLLPHWLEWWYLCYSYHVLPWVGKKTLQKTWFNREFTHVWDHQVISIFFLNQVLATYYIIKPCIHSCFSFFVGILVDIHLATWWGCLDQTFQKVTRRWQSDACTSKGSFGYEVDVAWIAD